MTRIRLLASRWLYQQSTPGVIGVSGLRDLAALPYAVSTPTTPFGPAQVAAIM